MYTKINKFLYRAALGLFAVSAVVILAEYVPRASALVQYSPAAQLQPNDITSAMIRASAITPSKIDTTAAFTFASTTSYTLNTGIFSASSTASLPASTTIATVGYNFPSIQGASTTNLQNDGSGNLSWVSASPTQLVATSTAGEALSINDAVYIKKDAGSGNVDAAVEQQNVTTGFSKGITIGNNSNRILLAALYCPSGTPTGVSATAGGQAMTLVTSGTFNTGASSYFSYIIIAPTVGAINISMSWTGGQTCEMNGWSGYGFIQSTTPDAFNVATGSGTSEGGSVTTITPGDWVATFMENVGSGVSSSGTNNILRAGFGIESTGDTNGSIGTPAATAQTFNTVNTGAWVFIQVALAPITQPVYRAFKTTTTGTGSSNGFLGFAKAVAVINANINIAVAGMVTGFSNLTPGAQYYLSDTAGLINTTAGTNIRKAAIALTNTQLLITNIW